MFRRKQLFASGTGKKATRGRSLFYGVSISFLAHTALVLLLGQARAQRPTMQPAALQGDLAIGVVLGEPDESPNDAPATLAAAVTHAEHDPAPRARRVSRKLPPPVALPPPAPNAELARVTPPPLAWSPPDTDPPAASESERPAPTAPPVSEAPTLIAAEAHRPLKPSYVSPGMAKELRVYDEFPSLPESLKRTGLAQAVDVEVCVSDRGSVSDITFDQHAARPLGDVLRSAIRTWRYRPLVVHGAPTPFCHALQIRYITN